MYSAVISVFAEQAKDSLEELSKYIIAHHGSVLDSSLKDVDGDSATIYILFATNAPHLMFQSIESWAIEGEPIPPELHSIYFEEAVYYIHAVPDNMSMDDIMKMLNFAINLGCVGRIRDNRLRSMVMGGQPVSDANQEILYSKDAMVQAINILSQRVLGTELLSNNNKEEVKWPVH